MSHQFSMIKFNGLPNTPSNMTEYVAAILDECPAVNIDDVIKELQNVIASFPGLTRISRLPANFGNATLAFSRDVCQEGGELDSMTTILDDMGKTWGTKLYALGPTNSQQIREYDQAFKRSVKDATKTYDFAMLSLLLGVAALFLLTIVAKKYKHQIRSGVQAIPEKLSNGLETAKEKANSCWESAVTFYEAHEGTGEELKDLLPEEAQESQSRGLSSSSTSINLS